LISAWSDEVVVIGAGRGSGAIITAEYAEKYGKKVIMMPYL
jgi:predicted Rossmann fold nucleotide-binding protein DprA/Smf involved in DNA uptake